MWAGGAALSVHALVVLCLPDVPAQRPVETPTALVWMTPASDSTLGLGAERDSASEGAAGEVAVHASTRRARRHAATGASVAAASGAATASAALGDGARANELSASRDGEASAALGDGASAALAAGGAGAFGDGVGAFGAGAHAGAGDVAAQLARKPRLLTASSPCRGYFPAQVSADHGVVRLQVQVDASGRTRGSRLLDEDGQARQFAAAASACAAALQFAPAIDTQGVAIASDAKLELRFDRS